MIHPFRQAVFSQCSKWVQSRAVVRSSIRIFSSCGCWITVWLWALLCEVCPWFFLRSLCKQGQRGSCELRVLTAWHAFREVENEQRTANPPTCTSLEVSCTATATFVEDAEACSYAQQYVSSTFTIAACSNWVMSVTLRSVSWKEMSCSLKRV